jgi:hypothetical protein
MSAYTDEQLIDLIRERSPQELSESEIAQLRREMRINPAVREALAAEVGLEQAIAVHYAPEADQSEEFVSRLDQILADRRRGWMRRVYGLAVVAFFVLAAFATAPYWMPGDESDPTPTVANRNQESETRPALPDNPPPQAAASAEVDPRGQASADTPKPAAEPEPAEPITLDWRHYVDPITVPALHTPGFADALQPIDKARWDPQEKHDTSWYELDGAYRLVQTPTRGRIVRLVFDSRQDLHLDFWRGNQGVRVTWQQDDRLDSHPIRRDKPEQTEPNEIKESEAADGPQTRAPAGVLPLDVGFAGQAIVLAKSDLPLLRVPFDGPPQQVILHYDGRLYLAQSRPAVVLPETPATEPPATDDEQAALLANLDDYQASLAAARSGEYDAARMHLHRADQRGASRDEFLHDYLTRATRQVWYGLAAAGDWSTLREDVLRRRAWSIKPDGTLSDDREDDAPLVSLGRWMLHRSLSAIGDELAGFKPVYYQHPLTVRADRETETLLAEFEAAVGAGQPEQAARLLVASSLTESLVAVGSDPDLLRSSHLLVRQTLRQTPELRSIIREEHEAVGRVRVGRAVARDDVEALEALALQFYGSEPGITATRHLADRDLSLGKFLSAAAWYQSLLDLPDPPDAPLLNAKLRLAWAMMGELRGEAVTADVQLGEHRYRAKDFEQLIRDLAASNGVSTAQLDQRDDGRASLKPGKLDVVHRATLGESVDFGRHDRLRVLAGRNRAAVIGADAIYLFDLADGQTHAFTDDGKKHPRPADVAHDYRPIPLEDGLIACWKRRDVVQLRRVDPQGRVRWISTPDRGVVGDPIRVGRWVYVLSRATDLGGRMQINLNRLDLESGEVVQSRRLMSVDPSLGPWHAGRGVNTPRGPVWVVASTLVATDTTGEVRWVRRLAFVPESVDGSLWPQDKGPSLAVHQEQLLVSAPGSPSVDAVEADTGRLLWSRPLPEALRVFGTAGDAAAVMEKQALTRIDPATGDVLGSTPLSPNEPTAATALHHALLHTTPAVESEDENTQPPRLHWLNPVTGEPAHSADLPPALTYLDLAPTGDRLLALTLDEQRKPVLMLLQSTR